jgi:acyl-CoA hydrolase
VVEANPRLPRTLGIPPEHPHAQHVDEIDVLIESDREPIRIVAAFAPGTQVTGPRHQVDVVVTEYAAGELAGLTSRERREGLRAIAHPDFRATLASAG